jgi:hypothetical protein
LSPSDPDIEVRTAVGTTGYISGGSTVTVVGVPRRVNC